MPVHLIPPNGIPTQSALAEEEGWSSLVATQLMDVRKTAENWRNGLVAMFGVITALSAIKGPDDMSGLNPWAQYTVGLLLLLSLSCATFGAWKALSAAYGMPSVITRDALRSLGGINGFRLKMAIDGASKLHQARAAMLATLLFLAMAIGLTWYGPRSTSVILDVERKLLPNVCGKLVASGDGYIDIKPSASEAIRVCMMDLVKVSAVEECP